MDDDEFEAVEHVDKYEAETDEDGNERDEESDGVEESSSLSPCTELSADGIAYETDARDARETDARDARVTDARDAGETDARDAKGGELGEAEKGMALNAGGSVGGTTYIRGDNNVVDDLIASKSNPNIF